MDTLRWRALRAVLNRFATTRMRERAWLAGFALALGDHTRHFWLAHLDEGTDGNETAWGLRDDHDDLQPGPCRPFLVQPVVGALALATSST